MQACSAFGDFGLYLRFFAYEGSSRGGSPQYNELGVRVLECAESVDSKRPVESTKEVCRR